MVSATMSAAVGAHMPNRTSDPRGCPRFTVRVIEDVAVGPSPGWMQRRLLLWPHRWAKLAFLAVMLRASSIVV